MRHFTSTRWAIDGRFLAFLRVILTMALVLPSVRTAYAQECGRPGFKASRTYSPSAWNDFEFTANSPQVIPLLEQIPVTAGNAGNGELTFTFTDNQTDEFVCHYVGGASTLHPTDAADVIAGQRYLFQGCTDSTGTLTGLAANAQVTIAHVLVHVVSGDDSQGQTEVTLYATPPCGGGQCDGLTQGQMDDGDPCTSDFCDPGSGVMHQPSQPGTPCGGANVCNAVCTSAGQCDTSQATSCGQNGGGGGGPGCGFPGYAAAITYAGPSWVDGDVEAQNNQPTTIAIPNAIPVTEGNAGHGELTLSLDLPGGGNGLCTYVGGASTMHPQSSGDVAAGTRRANGAGV